MSETRILAMLVVLAAANFVVTSSSSGTAPFLTAIATDLSTSLPAVANLFSMQALMWGTASLVAGTLSDRLGRRAILVVAITLLGATRLGFAASHSYADAALWQIVSGLGGGAFMGTVFAAVSDHVPAGTRGRALSWVITGQSLSLVLGVPILTLIGSLGGWRGAAATHGAAVLATAIAVRLAVPPDPARERHSQRTRTPLRAVAHPRLLALLAAGTTERVCFAALAIYLPTYLQQAYGVGLGALALALAMVALGNLAGNLLGGRIADRAHVRGPVFATASLLTAVLAVPTLMWQPGLAISVALGFAYAFLNAAGRPSLMAILSEVPGELRGAVFGLTVTMASIGWLLAGSVGAGLIASRGFVGLGLFCAVLAAVGAGLAFAGTRAGGRVLG
jgi:DHA1 family inner membrane transport protein